MQDLHVQQQKGVLEVTIFRNCIKKREYYAKQLEDKSCASKSQQAIKNSWSEQRT